MQPCAAIAESFSRQLQINFSNNNSKILLAKKTIIQIYTIRLDLI